MAGNSEFGNTEFVFEFGAGEFTPIDSHLIQLFVGDTVRELFVNDTARISMVSDTSVTVFVDGV
jgi:hypothetical protein